MSPVRILVIDDDPFVLRMTTRMLSGFDCVTTTARSGPEGIERFRRSLPDVVITDVAMPVPQGLEAIRTMREIAPALPILAISGGGWLTNCSDLLDMARRAGATDSLAKPFTIEQLRTAVSCCLIAQGSAPMPRRQPVADAQPVPD